MLTIMSHPQRGLRRTPGQAAPAPPVRWGGPRSCGRHRCEGSACRRSGAGPTMCFFPRFTHNIPKWPGGCLPLTPALPRPAPLQPRGQQPQEASRRQSAAQGPAHDGRGGGALLGRQRLVRGGWQGLRCNVLPEDAPRCVGAASHLPGGTLAGCLEGGRAAAPFSGGAEKPCSSRRAQAEWRASCL
jgi:hypothetical protein